MDGTNKERFLKDFQASLQCLSHGDRWGRICAMARTCRMGDRICDASGSPLVATPTLYPPVREPYIPGSRGYGGGECILCEVANAAAARLRRQHKLPSGLTCVYKGVWDGQQVIPMVEPHFDLWEHKGNDMCAFAWRAEWRAPSDADEVHVLYNRAVGISADPAHPGPLRHGRSGASICVPATLQADLNRFARMHRKVGRPHKNLSESLNKQFKPSNLKVASRNIRTSGN